MLANQVTLTRAPQDAHEMLLAGARKSFLELDRHCLPQAGHCSACIVAPNAWAKRPLPQWVGFYRNPTAAVRL